MTKKDVRELVSKRTTVFVSTGLLNGMLDQQTLVSHGFRLSVIKVMTCKDIECDGNQAKPDERLKGQPERHLHPDALRPEKHKAKHHAARSSRI
jgi:hypothetical protein